MSWFDGRHSDVVGAGDAVGLLRERLEDDTALVVGHHVGFDLLCLVMMDPTLRPLVVSAYAAGRIGCTQVRQQLIEIATGQSKVEVFSLEALVAKHLRETVSDKHEGVLPPGLVTRLDALCAQEDPDLSQHPEVLAQLDHVVWRLRYKLLRRVPIRGGSTPGVDCWPQKALSYVMLDSILAFRVWKEQEKYGEPPLLSAECRSAFDMQHLKAWGLGVDIFAVGALTRRVTTALAVVEGSLRAAGALKPVAGWHENTREIGLRVFCAATGTPRATLPSVPLAPEVLAAFLMEREAVLADIAGYDLKDKRVVAEEAVAYKGWWYKKLGYFGSKPPPTRLSAARLEEVAWDIAVLRTLRGWGGQMPPVTDTSCISASGDTLASLPDDVLRSLAKVANDKKVLSTFVPILRGGAAANCRVHPFWNGLVASGRSSCRNPNAQNQQRKGGVRECYVALPGWVLIACDLKAAEMVSLAQVLLDMFGHSHLADTLRLGRDPHIGTSAAFVGATYEAAYEAYHAGDQFFGALRPLGKSTNFGFAGALGFRRFVEYAAGEPYELDLAQYATPEDRAQAETVEGQRIGGLSYVVSRRIRETWFATYPEMLEYTAHISRLVNGGGGSATIHHPRTGFVRGGVTYTAAANHYFQHLTARATKTAMSRVVDACFGGSSALRGCRLASMIHDELLLEAPESRAADAALALSTILREAAQEHHPDVPCGTDVTLMRRWRKGAKEVRGLDGGLLPYEDRLWKVGEAVLVREVVAQEGLYGAVVKCGREPRDILGVL